MRRTTRDNLWVKRRAVDRRTHLAALRAAEQVAWQWLQAVAAGPHRPATYRAALYAWQMTRYDLGRTFVAVPPPGLPLPPSGGTPHALQRARTG